MGASPIWTPSWRPSVRCCASRKSKAECGRVFRRFYRLESSRSKPGSGLGLSLVEAIAALHGVSIDLTDNSPGLRFTLRFFSSDQQTLAGDRLAQHQTHAVSMAIQRWCSRLWVGAGRESATIK